jgi:hypothetical protein
VQRFSCDAQFGKHVFRFVQKIAVERRRKLWREKTKMVPAAGLEPTTPWFEARYSIQLSYAGRAISSIALFLPYSMPFEALKKLE